MNLIKWIKRKSILKKRIIIFEKQLKNAMDINSLNFHEGEIYGTLHLAYDLGIIDNEGYSGVTNKVSALLLKQYDKIGNAQKRQNIKEYEGLKTKNKNENFYAVLNVNDRCMDFDCRCDRVKFMDGFVVFQEHTNENDVTLAIIPKESILFIATE